MAKVGTIDDVINRLVTFCTKYPYIWRAKSAISFDMDCLDLERIIPDEDERRKVIEDVKQAKKDMDYINQRIRSNKLSEEQIQLLKNAGVFIEKDEVDELAEQYSAALKVENPKLTDDIIKSKANGFKKALRIKIAIFGGLDNYRQAYVDALARVDREEIFNVLMFESVSIFDISQDDFIAKLGFVILLQELGIKHMRENQSFIMDSQFIVDNSLKQACKGLADEERAQSIIIMRYGLDGNGAHTGEEIGEAKGISTARARQIEMKILSRMRNGALSRQYTEASILGVEAHEAFVRKYFEHHDIFKFSSSEGLTEEVRAELKRIYEEGTRDAIEDVFLEEQAIEDIKNNKVPNYVLNNNTYLSKLGVLSRDSFVRLCTNNISTVGKLLQCSTQELNQLPKRCKEEILRFKELLEGINFKTDSESIDLSDEVFDVLNFPGDISEVLAQHVQPVTQKEGIPFSVADFMMMSDDEISEIGCGPKKMEQIKAIRNKLRGHFRDIDVDRIEDSSHEKLVQIALMKQQTIADQEQQIDEMIANQQSRD